jgi:hypothetical protein
MGKGFRRGLGNGNFTYSMVFVVGCFFFRYLLMDLSLYSAEESVGQDYISVDGELSI